MLIFDRFDFYQYAISPFQGFGKLLRIAKKNRASLRADIQRPFRAWRIDFKKTYTCENILIHYNR